MQRASADLRESPPPMSDPTDAFDPDVIVVEDRRVSCDGGGGALGHPLVWYEMGDEDFVVCRYCDRRFVLKDGAHDLDRR